MSDKLILYGAGRYGVFAALALSVKGTVPICFCDKKTSGEIEPITGLPIISPQTLKKDYSDAEIIITAFTQKNVDDIYVDLDVLGIDKNRVSQYYSLHDTIMSNHELINFIARYQFRHGYNRNSVLLILNSVLKNQFEIKGDILRLKDLYFPYSIKNPNYFGVLSCTFLMYLSDLPYTRINVDFIDSLNSNHGYLLDDIDTPMIINKNDIVIDAGAWFGDFSLLATKIFEAEVYAFEPSTGNHKKLLKTIALNNCGDRLHAVKAGLGNHSGKLNFDCGFLDSGGAKISNKGEEVIDVTTIDEFVAENGIKHLDFIKADIEGYEREMLKGAIKTLSELAPKLSLCTYHLPDDPIILRMLISKANPAYKFEQRKNILFAWVDEK